jgi:lipid II:glycine glycyltransferase (peptidoglycan interpeptide bridge formation enzyme)
VHSSSVETLGVRHAGAYRLEVSTIPDDPAWDDFVLAVGGSHTQASTWAQLKASLGWRVARVVARADGELVGGAQLLIRPVPVLGGVGYIANGPVVAGDDPDLIERLLRHIRHVAQEQRVQHVTVQPPRGGGAISRALAQRGCPPSSTRVTPTTTLLVGLEPGPEGVLAAMSPRTRYNIRLASRRGVTVREGTEGDLATYGRLLRATADRQGFVPLPETYFAAMWQVLYPRGQLRFTLAEFEGETVAAQLAVVFGDTVTNKMSVWSGRHGSHRPNEAIQWSTIRWAAERGHRWYDLEGIDPKVARSLLAGEPLPTSARQSVTSYKLGFGGQAVLLPQAHDDLYNPVLRVAFARAYPHLRDRRAVRRLVKKVRTRPYRSPTLRDSA